LPGSVLVTGANGFLGAYVCRALRQNGYKVHGTVRANAGQTADIDRVSIITGLDDRRGLEAAAAGASAVVHLAARVHVMRDNAADPLAEFRRVNVDGTKTLLETAAATGVRRFVFVSSVKAVGEGNTAPWTDDVVPSILTESASSRRNVSSPKDHASSASNR
jgi:nucleoside-diphosphate-sugar epimerase